MQPLRVLIADDRDVVVARLARQLESLGHGVVSVKDAAAAVETAARLRPDLVVLGLHLRPTDGVEAARAIFSREPLPVILLTGYLGAELVRCGQDAGVLAFLVWPADVSALTSAIRVALTRFRELRLLSEQMGDTGQALRASIIVERAKRLLVRRLDLTEAEAFQYLRRQSESTGTSVVRLAANLLVAGELLFGKLDVVQCFAAILQTLTRREAVGEATGA